MNVRYFALSSSSLEMIMKFGSDQDKQDYIEAIYRAALALEKGEEVPEITQGSPILQASLMGAMEELKRGYATYMKRVNARNPPP